MTQSYNIDNKRKLYFVTYATHDERMFKELVNNEYDIKINVLGWNKKWNGFNDKIKGMQL